MWPNATQNQRLRLIPSSLEEEVVVMDVRAAMDVVMEATVEVMAEEVMAEEDLAEDLDSLDK